MKTIILLNLVILLLTGCISTRERMINAGYNPSYVDGYCDGESSGYFAARNPYYQFRKDTYRFDADSQYRQGWTDGYDTAKTGYQSVGQMLGPVN